MKLEGNICVFGDSIVWGAWDKEKAGWVNRLAVYCQNNSNENNVYNLGIPSETTTDLIKRIQNECEVRNPDTIIISIGINDSLYLKDVEKEKTNMDTFEKNIKKIINICRKYTENIAFLGLTKVNEDYTVPISWNDNEMYFNKSIERYNKKIEECCAENKISFLNVFEILEDEDLNIDGIHPNEIGHEKLFKYIKSFKENNMQLKFQAVVKDNMELAVKIQNIIFPDEDGRENYIECVNKDPYRKEMTYWIVYDGNEPIGVSGLYSYHEYEEDAWLGWFGVLPDKRKRGYGFKILEHFENYAKESGYKTVRLYTDEISNKEAVKLYTKRGMIREEYKNEQESEEVTKTTLIFSKSLIKDTTDKWNDKFLGLTEQGMKEK